MNTPKLSQVLPSARRVPRLSISAEHAERLIEIATRAYEGTNRNISEAEPVLTRMRLEGAVENAIHAAEWYVSEKHYEAVLPEFRKDGNALRKAINQVVKLLPATDEDPPFAQMRALHCYGDPQATGNEAGTPDEIEQRELREDDWEGRLSLTAVKAALVTWDGYLEHVTRATGTGRSEIVAERRFVSRLARYWTDELGLPLTSGRGEEGKAVRNSGLFPDFVRAAAAIIPREYRPHTFETAIEQIIARKT